MTKKEQLEQRLAKAKADAEKLQKQIEVEQAKVKPMPCKTNATPNSFKGKYVIVRARDAGVHAGIYVSHSGREVILKNSRRLWYWKGAFTLSALSQTGTTSPKECKFSCIVEHQTILDACEIIGCTQAARESIEGVPVWKS